MFKYLDARVNDFLGIPKSGWGEDFPSVEIFLLSLVVTWVMFVTLKLTLGNEKATE